MPNPLNRRSLTVSQKQAVTLLGAIGILACGACFVPSHYPPPPPPPHVTEGVKSQRDRSAPNRLDLAALTGVILVDMNRRNAQTHLSAYPAEKSPSEVDATLQVEILSVSATPQTAPEDSGQQKWQFAIQTSSILTRQNGQVLWRSTINPVSPTLESYAHDSEAMWKDPIIQSSLLTLLGTGLSRQATYQAPRFTAAPAND
jgi:hypothetical protein